MSYQININNVMSVYSGKDGYCCCGCSGKHTYASKYCKIASEDRGYKVNEDEISDRTIKIIVNKMNKILSETNAKPEKSSSPNYVSIVNGKRVYIAYYLPNYLSKAKTK
jgi:hypothetical protein